MRISSRLAIGLLAAAGVVAISLSGGAGAQAPIPAGPLKIAILDMNDCWNTDKSGQAKALQGLLTEARNKLNAELVDLQAELTKKTDQLKAMQPGEGLYTKLAMDYTMLEHRLKVTRELGQRGLVDLQAKYRNDLYVAARKMASTVALEEKIDLVLRGDDGAFEEEGSRTEMASQKNLLRAVLFYQPALDITPVVLKRLNDEFKAKEKAAGALCPTCKLAGVDGKCPKCGGALKNGN
jgi:Skp family chaperone for outer membrane proteins